MRFSAPADGTNTIEVDARPTVCPESGCRGIVVRHSLGNGQAVDRCSRCFRRFELRRPGSASTPSEKSRLRRIFDEFLTWQEPAR